MGIGLGIGIRDYGFGDNEDIGLTAAQLAEELSDLLNTLTGYFPYSYLTEKILLNTKCWLDVWKIISDHYSVHVNSETLLDFESIHKQEEETYRQFYERLLQHVKHHLAPAKVKVEMLVNSTADTMTISLMNFVALQWLRKVDPALINIIKTEYSTDLRANVQLAHLVPRIAPNIDSLLSRYESSNNNTRLVTQQQETGDAIAATVNKTWTPTANTATRFNRRDKQFRKTERGAGRNAQSRRPNIFCPGCYYLSQ